MPRGGYAKASPGRTGTAAAQQFGISNWDIKHRKHFGKRALMEMPQILALIKAEPYWAPAAALTAAPVLWPDLQSGAKEEN